MGSPFYCSMKAYMVRTAMTGMLCLSSSRQDLSGEFSQCKLLGEIFEKEFDIVYFQLKNIYFTKLT